MKKFTAGKKQKAQLYKCPECGLKYKEETYVKKCGSWCKEHQSCNLDVIKHAKIKN